MTTNGIGLTESAPPRWRHSIHPAHSLSYAWPTPKTGYDNAWIGKYRRLLADLPWATFPERPTNRPWPSPPPAPRAPFVAAYLVKLAEDYRYMADLRTYLVERPALVWLLGFPLVASTTAPWGFDVAASMPTAKHLGRALRELPHAALQFLLDGTVTALQLALPPEVDFGDAVAGDTKHIIAWVKENSPKAYVSNRYDKTQQPAGAPDCKLGCKRRHNRQALGTDKPATPATPTHNPRAAKTVAVGEFYWGYASGVVAAKAPDWGEFVLAELTQPFNQPDVSYFEPLLAATEERLGFRPPYAAFDAAFDAFYIYEYFDQPLTGAPDAPHGFAAVPFSGRGGHKLRFNPEGQPLRQADLPMPPRYTFHNKTTRVAHDRIRYACPLRWPQPSAEACSVNHKQ